MTTKELLLNLLLTDVRTASKLYYEHFSRITMTDNFWFTVTGKHYGYLIGYNNSDTYTHNTLIVRPKDWKQRDKKDRLSYARENITLAKNSMKIHIRRIERLLKLLLI